MNRSRSVTKGSNRGQREGESYNDLLERTHTEREVPRHYGEAELTEDVREILSDRLLVHSTETFETVQGMLLHGDLDD
jgi:hypothetical protein